MFVFVLGINSLSLHQRSIEPYCKLQVTIDSSALKCVLYPGGWCSCPNPRTAASSRLSVAYISHICETHTCFLYNSIRVRCAMLPAVDACCLAAQCYSMKTISTGIRPDHSCRFLSGSPCHIMYLSAVTEVNMSSEAQQIACCTWRDSLAHVATSWPIKLSIDHRTWQVLGNTHEFQGTYPYQLGFPIS